MPSGGLRRLLSHAAMLRSAVLASVGLGLCVTVVLYHRVSETRTSPAGTQFSLSTLNELIAESAALSGYEGAEVDKVLEEARKEDLKWSKEEESPPQVNHRDPTSKTKYILYWNEAYGSTEYGFCCGRDPFVSAGCPVNDCYATDNRTLLGADNVDRFDAILFHQRSTSVDDLPEKRSQKQRYIMYMIESADYPFSFNSEEWGSFFNWTMTYRRDSDFPVPYGHIEAKEPALPEAEVEEVIRQFGRDNRHLASGKNKSVAWFVSNCNARSGRDEFVFELLKHINVDIYGECGLLTCPRDDEDACWKKVENEYRFYLSFENSICTDYVTEKLFNALSKRVIPVVLGGSSGYNNFVPRHSVLNVAEDAHGKPAKLARIMRILERNDEAYAEYFWWKDHYAVSNGEREKQASFCEVCRRLHEEHTEQTYPDLEDWWVRKGKCHKARVRN